MGQRKIKLMAFKLFPDSAGQKRINSKFSAIWIDNLNDLKIIGLILVYHLFLTIANFSILNVIARKLFDRVHLYSDAFTYATPLFTLVENSHNNYFQTIGSLLTGGSPHLANLQPLAIAVFSMFINPEPESIALVNFLFFFVFLSLLSFILTRMGQSLAASLFATSLLWLAPIFYLPTSANIGAMSSPLTLFSLMPDPILLFALSIALLLSFIFTESISNRAVLVICAISVGLVFWARQNAYAYGLLLIILVVTTEFQSGRYRKKETYFRVVLWLIIIIAVAGFFYHYHFSRIFTYWSPSAIEGKGGLLLNLEAMFGTLWVSFFQGASNTALLSGFTWLLANMPGVLLTGKESANITILTSIVANSIPIAAALLYRRSKMSISFRFVRFITAYYYLNYFGLLVFLVGTYSNPSYRVFHPFLSLIPTLLILFSLILAGLVSRMSISRNVLIALAIFSVVTVPLLLTGIAKQRFQLIESGGVIRPDILEKLSVDIADLTKSQPITTMVYGAVSGDTIGYYLAKHNANYGTKYSIAFAPSSRLFQWSKSPGSIQSKEDFVAELTDMIVDAEFLLVSADRSIPWPCLLSEYREAAFETLAALINRFVVRMTIVGSDGGTYYLLEARGGGAGKKDIELNGTIPFRNVGVELANDHKRYSLSGLDSKDRQENNNNSVRYSSLFDKDDSSFLEYAKSCELIFERRLRPIELASYTIGTGIHLPEAIERMPVAWSLYGSDDGVRWQMLDRRENVDWSKQKEQSFYVDKDHTFNFLRFVALGKTGIIRLYKLKFTTAEGARSDVSARGFLACGNSVH